MLQIIEVVFFLKQKLVRTSKFFGVRIGLYMSFENNVFVQVCVIKF